MGRRAWVLVLSKWIQVHLEVLHRHADHVADVFLVAGMGEVDPFPEGLGAPVMDRLSQVVGHEPGFGLRLLQQEGLVGHGAPHVHADPDAVLAAQFGQLAGVGQMLSLGLEPEALVEVDHGHGDAQFLQLENPLLGVGLLVRLIVPGLQAAHPPPKERHVVPAPHDDDGLLVQPRRSFRTRLRWRTLTRFGSRPARTGKQQSQNHHNPRQQTNFHQLPRLLARIEQVPLRISLRLPQIDRLRSPPVRNSGQSSAPERPIDSGEITVRSSPKTTVPWKTSRTSEMTCSRTPGLSICPVI